MSHLAAIFSPWRLDFSTGVSLQLNSNRVTQQMISLHEQMFSLYRDMSFKARENVCTRQIGDGTCGDYTASDGSRLGLLVAVCGINVPMLQSPSCGPCSVQTVTTVYIVS